MKFVVLTGLIVFAISVGFSESSQKKVQTHPEWKSTCSYSSMAQVDPESKKKKP